MQIPFTHDGNGEQASAPSAPTTSTTAALNNNDCDRKQAATTTLSTTEEDVELGSSSMPLSGGLLDYEEPSIPEQQQILDAPRTSSLRDSMILRLTRAASSGGTSVSTNGDGDEYDTTNTSRGMAEIDALFGNSEQHQIEKQEGQRQQQPQASIGNSTPATNNYNTSTRRSLELAAQRAEVQRRADMALKDSGTTLSSALVNQLADNYDDEDSRRLLEHQQTTTLLEEEDEESRRQRAMVSQSVVRLPPPLEASYRTVENIQKSDSAEADSHTAAAAAAATATLSDAHSINNNSHTNSSQGGTVFSEEEGASAIPTSGGGGAMSTTSSVTNTSEVRSVPGGAPLSSSVTVASSDADGQISAAATGSSSVDDHRREEQAQQQEEVQNRAISMTGAIRVRGVNYRYTEGTPENRYDSASERGTHFEGGRGSDAFSLGDWIDPHPNVDNGDGRTSGNSGESALSRSLRHPIEAQVVPVDDIDDEAARRDIQERVDALERQITNPFGAMAFLSGASSTVVPASSVQSIGGGGDDEEEGYGGGGYDLDGSHRSTGSHGNRRRLRPDSHHHDRGQRGTKDQNCSIWWWPAGLCCLFGLIAIIIVIVAVTGNNGDGDSANDFALDGSGNATIEGIADSPSPVASPTMPPGELPPTLQIIEQRGFIRCRTTTSQTRAGSGITLDLCRSLSAAIFDGDWNRTEFLLTPWSEQWGAITSGDLDVSTAQVTFTMERDVLQPNAGVGMAFSSPFLYTGTLFAGPPELVECAETGETLLGVCSDLLICVVEETTTISVVQKHLDGSRILPVTDSLVLLDSLAAGNCNVLAGEPSALFEWDVRNAGYEGDYVFGSLLFSKEPLAMVTRGNDPEFADFVEWVFQALVTAEALNITQTDADLFPPTTLFGSKYSNMFSHAVAANGHYGEIYERNVEQGFPRAGMNFVTQQGDSETGLLFAIPFGNLAREDGPSVVAPDSMLHAVDDRNLVVCGVLADRPWLGIVNDVFDGIDVEFCRALSAAKFHGNTNQLAIVKYDTLEAGFEALDKKIIDVFASVPYTMENNVREASTGIGYSLSPPYFFDPSSDSAFSMATRQDDQQWSDFVRWTIFSTIYAEEQSISSDNASDLPTVDLFGPSHIQMFRFINLALGNYGDMYNRTQEARVPRAGANLLSSGGPHMIARPNDFGFE